jgi:hypothetical protein
MICASPPLRAKPYPPSGKGEKVRGSRRRASYMRDVRRKRRRLREQEWPGGQSDDNPPTSLANCDFWLEKIIDFIYNR